MTEEKKFKKDMPRLLGAGSPCEKQLAHIIRVAHLIKNSKDYEEISDFSSTIIHLACKIWDELP